jgi:hypothetical protein
VSRNIKRLLFCTLLLVSWNACADGGVIGPPISDLPPPPPPDPVYSGDVVGRDLNYPTLGWLGHLGIWDGGNVVEVVSGDARAIRFVSLSAFKSLTRYWGTASANIPNFYVYGCYQLDCYADWVLVPGGTTEIVASRYAIAKRAYQAYLIGADYTISEYYLSARPAYYAPLYPPRRGLYRCDTFVIDMLAESAYPISGYWWYENSQSIDWNWRSRFDSLKNGTITPSAVFDKLKTFR